MKKMQMPNIRNITYTISGFMTEELGLSGSALVVYAIIYSFTRGEYGLFFGSQEYLSRLGGISISTVKRAVNFLLSEELIEDCEKNERKGYRCTRLYEYRAPDEDDEPCNDAEKELFAPPYMTRKYPPDIIKKRIEQQIRHPKYVFHKVGPRGLIRMTAEQYKKLCTLTTPDILDSYLDQLEDQAIRGGSITLHNPYKLIKKWILHQAKL